MLRKADRQSARHSNFSTDMYFDRNPCADAKTIRPWLETPWARELTLRWKKNPWRIFRIGSPINPIGDFLYRSWSRFSKSFIQIQNDIFLWSKIYFYKWNIFSWNVLCHLYQNKQENYIRLILPDYFMDLGDSCLFRWFKGVSELYNNIRARQVCRTSFARFSLSLVRRFNQTEREIANFDISNDTKK